MPAFLEKTAIGAISGTSMDGIDIALLRTDGHAVSQVGPGRTVGYPAALRADLLVFLSDPSLAMRDPLAELEQRVTDAFTVAIDDFMRDEGIDRTHVDLIGLHGQTVYHRPELRFTRQLGLGQRMAADLGIDVVDGFRLADVAKGGHGAPLAPLYHAALAHGLPAVTTTGGALGATAPDAACLKLAPGDPLAMAGALSHIIQDGALRQRLGDSAWALAPGLPDWDDTARIVAGALKKIYF